MRWPAAERIRTLRSMNCNRAGRTTMNARHLIAALTLTLAAGATFAALKQGQAETPKATPVADCADATAVAIPRVVVTARRDAARSTEAPVARVVVTAKRVQAGTPIAAAVN
jgi:hypothetical protein